MKQLKEISQGIALALLIYVTMSSVIPLLVAPAYAQSAPIFSATLIASTGNPVRRQYASIIAANLRSVGIDARLFYVNFDVLDNRMFFSTAKQGSSFDQGGYDIGFIGWGFTSPVPDFRGNLDGRAAYWAPAGTNYALYNSSALNAVFDQLYATADPTLQKQLTDKAQEIVFNDKPYNFIVAPTDPIPINSKWSIWGTTGANAAYSEVRFPDVEHWSGGNQFTFAESSNVFPDNNLNPLSTPSSDSFYALYIYGAICYSSVGLQDVDARTLQFYPALATSITHTPDLLHWNVTIRQGVMFADGVEVTADDFLYTQYLGLNAGANSVNLGSAIQYLGNYVTFNFLNGTSLVDDNSANQTKTYGTWTATGKYSYTFTMPAPYAFTADVYGAIAPLPKHILEQIPANQIDSSDYSTAAKPHTYTWNTAQYGGPGTYTAVGPVCAGPYVLNNYDFTANVATLTKNPYFWNATGLQALGQYSVDTYKVAWISSKDAAIASLKNGEVDALDYNYALAEDVPTLQGISNVYIVHNSELGWQEMGMNMMNPVFGTGTATPAGTANATDAAHAALMVRTAISHLIPRDAIAHDLYSGAATPLASWIGPGWGVWYDPNLTPDTYDVNAAVQDLQAAGYSVQFTPPAPIAYSGTPMLGQSITVSGTSQIANEYVVIEQSTDNSTWNPVAAAISDNSSKYSVAVPGPPVFGTVYYAANFTGYAAPNQTIAMAPITPDQVNTYINSGAIAGGKKLIAEKLSTSITVSSTTNDALVVLVPIIIIVVVGALVMRTRKKKTTEQK